MATAPRADCARCAAFCCAALAFDNSRLFAFDKPAGVACRNLGAGGGCAIHGRREEAGMAGCVSYDCGGAGPYVQQEMFAGRSWLSEPDLAEPMFAAFSILREVFDLAAMVEASRALALPGRAREEAAVIAKALLPDPPWRASDVTAGRPSAAARRARAFLASLRPFVEARARA